MSKKDNETTSPEDAEIQDAAEAAEKGDGGVTKKVEAKAKKKSVRKPMFLAIPFDIDNLEAVDPEISMEPPVDDEGKPAKVDPVSLDAGYKLYAIPPGRGMKDAVRKILEDHNVDLKNVHRCRLFTRTKDFEVEKQYRIRF